jgi:hypothetical protein
MLRSTKTATYRLVFLPAHGFQWMSFIEFKKILPSERKGCRVPRRPSRSRSRRPIGLQKTPLRGPSFAQRPRYQQLANDNVHSAITVLLQAAVVQDFLSRCGSGSPGPDVVLAFAVRGNGGVHRSQLAFLASRRHRREYEAKIGCRDSKLMKIASEDDSSETSRLQT